MEEEGQTSLKAVRLDIEKLVRLHSLAMSEFAWNRVVSRQLPFGVIGVFFFFQGKSLIERYPSFLIIKINPPPLPRHFSPKSQLVSVWRRRGGGEGEGGGGKRCGEDSIEKRAPDEVQHFAPKMPLSTQEKK